MTDEPTDVSVPTTTRARGSRPHLEFPDHIRAFLDDVRFATISTIDPDGTPRQAVTWYTVEGDEIVVNSRVGRRWPTNLLRDPRIALSVIDAADGLRWVGLTGTVEAVTDRTTTQADIAGMARRHEGDDPAMLARSIAKFEAQDRISFRIRPSSFHDHLDE